MLQLLVLALSAAYFCLAQFPAEPKGITTLRSRFNNNVSISYKETHICETTPGVKGYAGYVHLPPYALEDLDFNQSYPINTFFWFFEARKDPHNAPLSIWLNGGPGSSSLIGLLGENGPCFVNPDSKSTRLNEWSWNNEVNMLYLDQPVQTGLSYNTRHNITVNLIDGHVTKLNKTDPIPQQNATFHVGTRADNDNTTTAFGSVAAAAAMWHFAQAFFQEFPKYSPADNRISLAAESYGGRYGPNFFTFFEEQNERIRNGTWKVEGETYILHLDSLVLVSGCIDNLMWNSYSKIAYNNTYGIKAINESTRDQILHDLTRKRGCLDQTYKCGNLSMKYDPKNIGINDTVNQVCANASNFCNKYVQGPYTETGRNFYDITAFDPVSFTPPFYEGYLNQPFVQEALGVPVNWTGGGAAVGQAFGTIGDFPRPGHLDKLAYLLERGIKVSLMYGDRDYVCNWISGEDYSLAINYTDTKKFHAAGYAPVQTNDSYIGGQVRQHGNLSYTRVYQAGHGIPAYQPETAYQIFTRVIQGRDIATGKEMVTDDYSTKGIRDTFAIKNVPPPPPLQVCYIPDLNGACTKEQIYAVGNGTVLIRDYLVVDRNTTLLYPEIVGDGKSG